MELSVSLVGLGYWGQKYLRLLSSRHPELILTSVVERDPQRLEAVGIIKGAVSYNDHTDMIASCRPDVAIVCTEATAHRGVVEDLLRSGVAVLVEKPLATSLSDARELTALAERTGTLLMTGHTFLFEPAIVEAGRLLHSGAIGAPRWVGSTRHGFGPVRHDVSVEWDLLPHDLSILLRWFGSGMNVNWAHGTSALSSSGNDRCVAGLTVGEGVTAFLDVSWFSPVRRRDIILVGEDRSISLDLVHRRSITVHESGAPEADRVNRIFSRGGPPAADVELLPVEPLAEQLDFFVRAVMDRAYNVTLLREAVEIVGTIESIVKVGRSDD